MPDPGPGVRPKRACNCAQYTPHAVVTRARMPRAGNSLRPSHSSADTPRRRANHSRTTGGSASRDVGGSLQQQQYAEQPMIWTHQTGRETLSPASWPLRSSPPSQPDGQGVRAEQYYRTCGAGAVAPLCSSERAASTARSTATRRTSSSTHPPTGGGHLS